METNVYTYIYIYNFRVSSPTPSEKFLVHTCTLRRTGLPLYAVQWDTFGRYGWIWSSHLYSTQSVSTHLISDTIESIYSVFLYKASFFYQRIIIRHKGGFAMKLTKFNFLGPSLAHPFPRPWDRPQLCPRNALKSYRSCMKETWQRFSQVWQQSLKFTWRFQ